MLLPLASFLTLFILFLIFNFLYFLLPRLSPIPFYPTNKLDLNLIVKQLLQDTRNPASPRPHEASKKQEANKKSSGKATFDVVNSQLSNVIIDLGAGIGTVIFASATASYNHSKIKYGKSQQSIPLRRWNMPSYQPKFVAIEIHPLLILIMHLRRLFHPNRKNIQIIRGDIFKMDYKNFQFSIFNFQLTVYLYVDPHSLSLLKPKLFKMPKTTRIISYMYEIPGWKSKLKKTINGVNKIFLYEIS